MMNPSRDPTGKDVLRDDALDWLRLLTGGMATNVDVAAFDRWRTASPDHDEAFAEAALLWDVLGDAARMMADANPDLAVMARPRAHVFMKRRAFLFGGGMIAASLAGIALVRPPLGLWPSFVELKADYRTRKGQQRRIDLADKASIEINTQTSIDLRPTVAGRTEIELITGEAAVAAPDAASAVIVLAGGGSVETDRGAFNVRKSGDKVSVTCIDGEAMVRSHQGGTSLRGGQQVSYGAGGLGRTVVVDPVIVAAWRHGLLVFHEVPLAQLIDEVNRYRPGKIVLLDSRLAQRRVVATFRLDRIDDVVTFVHQALDVSVRILPGGIVLLG
jgi:transmembrane sensor